MTRQDWTVDYTCSVEELYIQVARSILTESTSLFILYSNLTKKKRQLPSWVPDWSTWQFGSYGMACWAGYSASGQRKAEIKLHYPKNLLEVNGCLVDRLIWLSDSIGPYYEGRFQPGDIKQRIWLKEQLDSIRNRAPPASSKDNASDDILWRCLTGNITLQEHPAKANYKEYFDAHLNCQENSSATMQNLGCEFHDAVRRRSRYRRLGATNKGYFGALPETADIGDWVCMFYGGNHLFVIRECEGGFEYIGHAYVDGLMNGECLELKCEERSIILV